jgi:hypothetical protein
MSRSDRDPLFFPPSKHPPQGEDEPEEHSVEVDTESQQKPLRWILLLGLLLGILLWRGCA